MWPMHQSNTESVPFLYQLEDLYILNVFLSFYYFDSL